MTEIALPVEQTRAEDTLGASDAAAALGLDRYRAPITVWRQLRGLPVNEERPPAVAEAARYGQLLEPIIRGEYALERNVGVFVPTQSIVHDGWLRCTPDGFVVQSHPDLEHAGETVGLTHEWQNGPPNLGWMDRIILAARASGNLGLYQGKTCSAWLRDEWASGPPPKHEIQCRVEMAVCNLPWNDISCLIGGQQRVTYRVERDAALEDRILTDLRAFWRAVKEGVEPSPDHTAAWREHITERMQVTKIAITPTSGQAAMLLQWKAARAELAATKRKEGELKNRLLLELSGAGATAFDLGPDGKVTAYRTGARTDWKRYAVDNLPCRTADLERYKGKSGSFTLRAPWGDDDGE